MKIPFATRIRFDGDPRAYGMFSDMIKASAVFRYQKREENEAGQLIATIEDFVHFLLGYADAGVLDLEEYLVPITIDDF